MHNILVELLCLNYDPSALPTLWMVAEQVLNVNMISNLQGLEELGMFRPFLMLTRMPFGKGFLSVSQ